jgi:hypothetical protein
MRDFSLLGFIEHLAVIGAEVVHAEHHALQRGAEIIEKEAKASVGTYQPQSGPFAEWDELAQSTQDERAKLGFPENEPELRTGEMAASIEHTIIEDGREAEIGSDSQVLEWQELGTARMPPRSILGGAAARKADDVANVIGSEVVTALVGSQVHLGRLAITGSEE